MKGGEEMENTLSTLDRLGDWEDDLEIEELSSIQSATVIVVIVVGGTLPHNGLTTPQV
jgi:hypothetical protein